MAIILLISKGPTRWCGNLKGLSYERRWLKSADSLGASPFKRNLSNDTTFKSCWKVPLRMFLRFFCAKVKQYRPE